MLLTYAVLRAIVHFPLVSKAQELISNIECLWYGEGQTTAAYFCLTDITGGRSVLPP